MITLTMQCSRCSKEVSHDMTNQTLSNDLVRKFGYAYAHTGKTNTLICQDCERLFRELKDTLEDKVAREVCSFFGNCQGKGNGNGNTGEPENG